MVAESDMKVFEIPMDKIFSDNDFNCRGSIEPLDVIDLARSIEEIGLHQPITVQPWNGDRPYRIVSGHRRYMAFKLNKAKTIPSFIKEGLTELEAKKLNLEENLKRKDLNILQESKALQPFLRAGWTQEDMAVRFNQSRGWVQARVALLYLPDDIQQEAAAGMISQEHIKQLKTLKSPDQQREAVKKIKDSKIKTDQKKVKINVAKKKLKPLSKKRREPQEVLEMMELFMGVIGPGFYSRCLAWSIGEISTYDLLRDFREHALEDHNKQWIMPKEILEAVSIGE
jgi:ParB/RepB/Spo0J family partition protein